MAATSAVTRTRCRILQPSQLKPSHGRATESRVISAGESGVLMGGNAVKCPPSQRPEAAIGSRHMLHIVGASDRAWCSESTAKPWRW